MADKSVGELIAAQSVTPTDLFVLEQNGTAKKLTGQILENWLVSFADGHGGIQSIAKLSTSGLADTYRITLADTTTFDFVVNNGRGISGITKTATEGLVDTYTISYNDNTSETFTVTNGAKGDKGDNQYVWIKYASQKPTASSHYFGDVADNWIGVYSGDSATAPTDWTQYEWFQIKGEKGDTGEPATLTSSTVEYQVSDSGTIIPSGAWSSSVPVVAQGKYMWTRTTNSFNTGNPVVAYSVSRMGIDGSGSVSSVAGISPNADGNVPLKAEDVGALPSIGGDLTGELKMNGQPISGLNAPTANDQVANMGFVNQQVKKAAPRNLLDNSDFTNPVNQRGAESYSGTQIYTIDRWKVVRMSVSVTDAGIIVAGNSETGLRYLFQKVCKNLAGKKITAAISGLCAGAYIKIFDINIKNELGASETAGVDGVCMLTCEVPSAYTDGVCVNIYVPEGETITPKWAALYEGEYTAETLPEYQPKGYGAELAECMRYYQKFATLEATGYLTSGATAYNINLILPVPMRVKPTIAETFKWLARIPAGGYSAASGSSEIDATNMSLWSEQSKDVSAVSLRDTLTASAGDANNSILNYRVKNVVLSADL